MVHHGASVGISLRVAFIDVDGVLNSVLGAQGEYIADMEEEKLSMLTLLAFKASLNGVVLTTDRRLLKDSFDKIVQAIDGLVTVLGVLRDPKEDDTRGQQIVDFLETAPFEIERMVILDDNDDGISTLFPDQFVLVNKFYGLNEEVVDKAANIINS